MAEIEMSSKILILQALKILLAGVEQNTDL